MQALEKIGLSKNETKVYILLLESGSSTAGNILKRINLHRSKVYDTLDRLVKKGLASVITKNKVKHFQAASPESLLNIVESKERDLQQQKKEINNLIPKLKAKQIAIKTERATLFEGNTGIRSILQDMIKEGKEIYNTAAYSEEAEALKYNSKYYLPKFYNLRKEKKITMNYIFPEKSKKRALELKGLKFTNVRVLSSEFASSTSTTVYGDKVAIIVWTKDPIGFLIEDKKIAKNQRNYFKFLWGVSDPLII